MGNFPAVVVRVERQVPRRDPPLLEGGRRQRLGIRHPLLRLQRPVRVEQPPAARQHQFRHLPRRIHARTTWSATTRSTTRPTAKTTATATDDNHSWNCGVEGPTDDPAILALRQAAASETSCRRCCFSQGVPMMLAATRSATPSAATTTPTARTTRSPGSTGTSRPQQKSLLQFVRRLAAVFQQQPVFHRRRFFHGKAIRGAEAPEIAWLDPAGNEMSDEAWNEPFVPLPGRGAVRQRHRHRPARRADRRRHDLAVIQCRSPERHRLSSAAHRRGLPWELLIDTFREQQRRLAAGHRGNVQTDALFRGGLPEPHADGENGHNGVVQRRGSQICRFSKAQAKRPLNPAARSANGPGSGTAATPAPAV